MPNYRNMIARIIKSRGVHEIDTETLSCIDNEIVLEINDVCQPFGLRIENQAWRYLKTKPIHELVKLLNVDQPDFENWVWNNIDDICKS